MTHREDHVGCIDGQIVVIVWLGNEITLTVGDGEARLSVQAAARLASLLTADTNDAATAAPSPPDTTPSDPQPLYEQEELASEGSASEKANDAAGSDSDADSQGDPGSPGPRPKKRELMAELLGAGLIDVGAVLSMTYRTTVYQSVVTSDGMLAVQGHVCKTPSEAAGRVTGGSVNGWDHWTLADGTRLADLRWRLRAEQFPGAEHDYADPTVEQKRRLARRWVEYAQQQGIDPGVRDKQAIAALLAEKNYTDLTREGYRRHLDLWFEMYGRRRPSQ